MKKKLEEIEIMKASGESEPFSTEKLTKSLSNAGADLEEINNIIHQISLWIYNGVTTRQIYQKAYNLLQKQRNHIASRYKLKKAIMELGPTGYPFERFVAKIFDIMGFSTQTGLIMKGCCVSHEMDVVAIKDNEEHLVECKYGQSSGRTVSVQVPLYVRSRINDIIDELKKSPDYGHFSFHGWVVTNTRFTSDAIDYGKCCGLHLLSWDYPSGNGMKDIIDREKIYPVTVLSSLLPSQKQILLENGIVICRQLREQDELLKSLNLTSHQLRNLMTELSEIT